MKIEVTQEHIDKGRRRSCWGCPVALAMRSAGLLNAHAAATFYIWGAHGQFFKDLPKDVTSHIEYFDQTGKMRPFSFELEV